MIEKLAFTRYCITSKLYCGWESIILLLPPPTCKAYPILVASCFKIFQD